jgi:hypothetical protein
VERSKDSLQINASQLLRLLIEYQVTKSAFNDDPLAYTSTVYHIGKYCRKPDVQKCLLKREPVRGTCNNSELSALTWLDGKVLRLGPYFHNRARLNP